MSYAIAYLDETLCHDGNAERLFNPHDPKYRCCFRCCHVRLGVVFICIVECLAASLTASLALVSYFSSRPKSLSTDIDSEVPIVKTQPSGTILENEAFLLCAVTVSISMAVAIFVTVFMALYGISKQKKAFILPYLVALIVAAVILLGLIGLLAWSTASAEGKAGAVPRPGTRDGEQDRDDRTVLYVDILIVSLIASSVALVLQMYFIFVTYQCYRYIRCRATYGRVASFAIAYSGSP